jgi:hypothetical protein
VVVNNDTEVYVNKIDNQYRLHKLLAKERTRVAEASGICLRRVIKLSELLSPIFVCLLVVTFRVRLSEVVPADYYYYYYYCFFVLVFFALNKRSK